MSTHCTTEYILYYSLYITSKTGKINHVTEITNVVPTMWGMVIMRSYDETFQTEGKCSMFD